MSRSKRGGKGPGYEYWGRRPGGKMPSPGRVTKTLTHRAERQVDVALARGLGRRGREEHE